MEMGIERSVKRSRKHLGKPNKKNKVLKESDPLALYFRQISRFPLLTLQEEQNIGEKIISLRTKLKALDSEKKKNKDIDSRRRVRMYPESNTILEQHTSSFQDEVADISEEKAALERALLHYKNKMINSNLRLVVSIAKNYQHRGLSLLDLIDEGNIGLIEAVERFDYTKGFRFSTYGTWWIKQAIIKSIADKGRLIRIPIHMLNTIKKCYYIAKQLTQEFGRDPNEEELSMYLGVSPDRVKELIFLSQEATSLDAILEEGNTTRLFDLIKDDNVTEPFEIVFSMTLQDTILGILSQLSDREMKIIQLRFGLTGENPLTLEETGKTLGITRERVRQIQEKAVHKLKSNNELKKLRETT